MCTISIYIYILYLHDIYFRCVFSEYIEICIYIDTRVWSIELRVILITGRRNENVDVLNKPGGGQPGPTGQAYPLSDVQIPIRNDFKQLDIQFMVSTIG